MIQEKSELEQARERIGELEAEIERLRAAMRGMQRALGIGEPVRPEEIASSRAALVDAIENAKSREKLPGDDERALQQRQTIERAVLEIVKTRGAATPTEVRQALVSKYDRMAIQSAVGRLCDAGALSLGPDLRMRIHPA